MLHSSKYALIATGLLSVLSFTHSAHAANPLEQIVSQEVDKYQQRGKERVNQEEQHRNRHDDRNKQGHHGHDRHDHDGDRNNAKSCNDERNFRSVQGSVHTSLKFTNNTRQEVRTYWLDYNGRRVFYKAIPPHGQYTQPTFQTHPWVVTDTRDNCLHIFVSNQPAASVDIR
jgi:hypothetical protein